MKLTTLSFHMQSGWSEPFPTNDSSRTLVVVFGASEFFDNPTPLEQLREAFPTSHVVGCSTSGEIHGDLVLDGSLSVAVMQFETSEIATAFTQVHNADDSFAAGQDLAAQLNRDDLKAVFVLSDGLKVNGSELVRGFNDLLPSSITITGGLAGDGDRFGRTWNVCNSEPQEGIVSAVGFYGSSIKIGHGSQGGWDRFGPERTVTRSSGNVLFEFDGQPALELYKKYLGEQASELPATGLMFPLAVRENGTSERRIVRTILAVDEDTQSMTFAGDIPQGCLAQLMRANFDRLEDGASGAATMTQASSASSGDILSIAISCVGRRLVLGERTEEEIEATLDALPDGTRQIGFYSYGEISPYASGYCELHNQTMTLTTIGEDS
ncbi:MAG: hypothetical protein ACI9EF_001995 [Pseudohongiellaceae bacterium]|jgi:hypothetical protein